MHCQNFVILHLLLAESEGPLLAYCVEKVERQRFQEGSDVRRFHDRSIEAVLVSLGR